MKLLIVKIGRRPRLSTHIDAPNDAYNTIADVSLNTQRTTETPFPKRTTRSNDPLDPVYYVNGDIVADNPKFTKSRPRISDHAFQEGHQLMTHDIPGM